MERSVFELFPEEYDEWFEEHKFAYLSELEALKRAIPEGRKGLEIGVGTGRFAKPLGIKIGIDPSEKMLEIARKRGIEGIQGRGENLPFKEGEFDFALLAFTLCFVDDPLKVLGEAKRVLKPGGRVIVGIIDKDSKLGKIYQSKKEKSKFYKFAKFYSSEEIIDMLRKLDFTNIQALQTLSGELESLNEVEAPKEGYGQGGFVVIYGEKRREEK
ncbi:class I SAM-dependent methyltransferase [bacterium]|nr:class I SAM-dependent methyltransferase [bacterium]